jgi:polysaccharide export outer membrane protein
MMPLMPGADWAVHAIAQCLFHALWQSCLLATLAICILQVLGNTPHIRYLVLLALLLLMSACPFATLAIVCSGSSGISMVSGQRESGPDSQCRKEAIPNPHTVVSSGSIDGVLQGLSASIHAAVQRHQSLIVRIWLVGFVVCGTRILLAACGVFGLSRSQMPLPANTSLDVGRLSRAFRFRTQPAIAVVSHLTQALTVGIIKPVVLLPAVWVLELDPDVLEAVVAHELAHVRRWDLQINFLQRMIEALLFFNPVVWWCSRRLRVERELCCDELAASAIGNRARYAQALCFLAEQHCGPAVPVLGAGIGGSRMVLLERIRNVLGLTLLTKNRFYGPSCALAGAIAASFLWAALLLASREAPAGVAFKPEPRSKSLPVGAAVPFPRPARTASADVPSEQRKVILPEYRIDPPDILKIEAPRLMPKKPYLLQAGDAVSVEIEADPSRVRTQSACEGIVDSMGMLSLGPATANVHVSGMTEDEAAQTICRVVRTALPEAKVIVRLVSARVTPVSGEHLVSPDGRINLGPHGQVLVGGMTLQEATKAVNEQLGKFFDDPNASVEVFAYNSKVYYVITEGAGAGDLVARLAITGNETVLDAVAQINGLGRNSSRDIQVLRPNPASGSDTVLSVNWRAISEGTDITTNYQIMPGDRILVSSRSFLSNICQWFGWGVQN